MTADRADPPLDVSPSDRPAASEPPVLLVEDMDGMRALLKAALEGQGLAVIEARDEPEAVQALNGSRMGVVLSDLKLPAGDGLGVLRAAKALDPELPVFVMTAYGGVQDAVAAIKEGAEDFLPKPLAPEHLLPLIERALERRRLESDYASLPDELAGVPGVPTIVGAKTSLREVLAALTRAAKTDTTVLLQGESGTGKELFAQALHALSPRAAGPFVAINCAAIPETLLETELFGHEKGAFTGAVARKLGRFEVAQHGTLFLDEIGDLPLSLQAKILRALEERRFERVGGTASIDVDVRIVAATNQELTGAVAAQRFREDLFFRLSVFPITIPPLRRRGRDIVVLARHFVRHFCREVGRATLTLSPQALDAIARYDWPGNVRELQNCIERAVILADGETIQVHNLKLPPAPETRQPEPTAPTEEPVDPWSQIDLSGTIPDVSRRVLAEVERRKIVQALRDTKGDRVRASELLHMKYKSLLARMRTYGIPTSP